MRVICPNPEDISDSVLEFLRRNFKCYFKKISQKKFDSIANNFEVIISRFNHKINYKQNSKIKYILSPTTGVDHIDEKFFKKKKKIFCLKNQFKFLDKINASSEYSIYLILKSLKKFDLNRKNHSKEVNNQNIGIIGYGRIGKKVDKSLTSMGANVKIFDKNSKKIPTFKRSSLNDILRKSSLISLHIPLDKKNKNFLNNEKIKKLKKNCIIINTSRGDIVEEKFIYKKILNKKIIYITDVIGNFLKGKLKYLSKYRKNFLYTKHVAGLTRESIQKTDNFILKKFLDDINL